MAVESHVFERVDQLALFEASGKGIDAAFARFHRNNPIVYQLLVKFARKAKAAGWRHFGIGEIWERLRWYVHVDTRDQTGLKLNNNFRSRYSRLLMHNERCSRQCAGCDRRTCLAGLFEIRHCPTLGPWVI